MGGCGRSCGVQHHIHHGSKLRRHAIFRKTFFALIFALPEIVFRTEKYAPD
jgi:hypothetical protein